MPLPTVNTWNFHTRQWRRMEELETIILELDYCYRELDEPLITDAEYSVLAVELIILRDNFKREFEETKYKEYFRDYTGSTDAIFGTGLSYPEKIIKRAEKMAEQGWLIFAEWK